MALRSLFQRKGSRKLVAGDGDVNGVRSRCDEKEPKEDMHGDGGKSVRGEMTVGGRRRLGRRGERENGSLARELDTLAHQNESELDLPDAGFVRFRTDAPKPPASGLSHVGLVLRCPTRHLTNLFISLAAGAHRGCGESPESDSGIVTKVLRSLTRTPSVFTGLTGIHFPGPSDGAAAVRKAFVTRRARRFHRPCLLQHPEPPSFVSSTRLSMACVLVMALGYLTITITTTTQSRL